MTLRIKISHDQPGYLMTAVVKVFDLNDLRADVDAAPKEVKVIGDGESASFYVYDIQQLVIEEGPPRPVVNDEMPQDPAIHGAALLNSPEAQVAAMPLEAFVAVGEMRADGELQTEESLAKARAGEAIHE